MREQTRYSLSLHLHDRRLRLIGILLGIALLTLCGVISFLISSGYNGSEIEDVSYSYMYSFTGRVGYILPLIVGALVVSSEFHSGQMARTVVSFGSRTRAFIATTASSISIGAVLGLIFLLAAFLVSTVVVSATGHRFVAFDPEYVTMFLRTAILVALWAGMGAALAWIIRNQTVVIAGVLAFAVFIEPTISAAGNGSASVMAIVKWLPGPLNWSISWPSSAGSATVQRAISLEWWQSGLVMIVYVVVLTVLAYLYGCRSRGFAPSTTK